MSRSRVFNYKLNSCVISRDNCLEYSDDKYAINPESSIFSLNIGAPSAVLFRNKITGEEHRHLPKPNSFLVMSRSSQTVFSHRNHIEKSCNGPLYTLTCNTRAIKFGSGRGTVGERYPGKQVYAPIIEQIDPLVCTSYQNVVLSLGINDIKSDDIRSRRDVEQVYNRFKTKIHDIVHLNTRARIFIIPVLPTGSEVLNTKVIDFNHLLVSDLVHSCYSTSIVQGIPRFLHGQINVLKSSLLKRQGDILHINSMGHSLLVKLMKEAIYLRRKVLWTAEVIAVE